MAHVAKLFSALRVLEEFVVLPHIHFFVCLLSLLLAHFDSCIVPILRMLLKALETFCFDVFISTLCKCK